MAMKTKKGLFIIRIVSVALLTTVCLCLCLCCGPFRYRDTVMLMFVLMSVVVNSRLNTSSRSGSLNSI